MVGHGDGPFVSVPLFVLLTVGNQGDRYERIVPLFSLCFLPAAIDEAAMIDGCTHWQVFTKITLPLSRPIIVYTILISFIAPWVDFIFAKVICRANADQYTVAIGLWKMLEKEYIDNWYTCFAAGAVLISIPIAALFLYLQKYYVDGLTGGVKG
jgi:arabinogalactan oligomer/maltooligosaccharide transport system permease protein